MQRWEERRGFPVKRLPGGDRGNVYALASEVDEWLLPARKVQTILEGEPEGIAAHASAPFSPTAAPNDRETESAPGFGSLQHTLGAERSVRFPWLREQHWRSAPIFGVLASLTIAVAVFSHLHQERVQAEGPATHAAARAAYTSPVAGVNELYLQGMYLFEKRTPDSLEEARNLLAEVTNRDPKNAPAWAGLAETATLLYEYGVESDPGAPARARAAAEQALVLDPALAEPHAVLGFADFFWDGNVRDAEPEFRSALRLNPESAMARSWYGTFLTYEARYPEALQQLNRAQALQPASTAILSSRALALGLSGHKAEAVQLLEQTAKENRIASVRFNLAVLSLMQPSNADVFLREQMQLATLAHSQASYRIFAAAQVAYQKGGEPAMWRSILVNGTREHMSEEMLAGAHAALGDNEAAVQALAEAQRKSARLVGVSMNPLLLPLHSDPRFKQIVMAAGLPPSS